MTLTSPVRIGIDPCGCLNESLRRFRVLQSLAMPQTRAPLRPGGGGSATPPLRVLPSAAGPLPDDLR